MSLALESRTSSGPSDLSLEDYLRRHVASFSPVPRAVISIAELSAGVWSVELEGGSRLVAKHQAFGSSTAGAPDDLLLVEFKVLNILNEHGCDVPRALTVDPETRFIYLEHCGDRTLDDRAQESGVSPDLSAKLVAGFCRIEKVLSAQREVLLPHVSRAATRGHHAEVASSAPAEAQEGLAMLLSHCDARSAAGQALASCLHDIWMTLSGREPTLASTDFNARNVVIDSTSTTVSFIEFAKIGWDWPERRLVQYATSLGAGREDGEFICPLSPESIEFYAKNAIDGAFALDGHHILFHLQAAAMLCRSLAQPSLPRHRALLHAWQRPQHRLRQLVNTLASPLTSDTPAADFRSLFSEAVQPFIDRE